MKTLSFTTLLVVGLGFFVLGGLESRLLAETTDSQAPQGYYRFPAIYGDTIVFTAEGDLWRVGVEGGTAQRLTSHTGYETRAAFSPDGKTIVFSAEYEGPTEVYTMPAEGGLPARRTFEGRTALVVDWTPDGKIIYATTQFSTLPDVQLATLDLKTGETAPLPLSQASDGVFDPAGNTLYFTRLPFQGSRTKRYQGGTIQHLWKYTAGDDEAVALTEDFAGTSKSPMWWQNRIYFVSDRDGTMNVWSMNLAGTNLTQHTHHKGWDVKSARLGQGRIIYQLGADLHLYDIAGDKDKVVPIRLATDLDQERERWVKKPMEYLTAAHLSPDGDRLALTARGQVFVAPVKQGRFVEVTHDETVRFRDAQFLPDGKSLIALSDASGELEFCEIPANGVGKPKELTSSGPGFRFDGVPSPDGKWVAYSDKDYQLWIFNVADKKAQKIDVSTSQPISDVSWSPDNQWLAYVRGADNTFPQIWLYSLNSKKATPLTTDRTESFSPVWHPDGKWIYFLSKRHLESSVSSPWGLREPEPYFDQLTSIYHVALTNDLRSPFQAPDELIAADEAKKDKAADKKEKKDDDKKDAADKKEAKNSKEKKNADKKTGDKKSEDKTNSATVVIDLNGIQTRVLPVPVPPGNYTRMELDAKHLFVTDTGPGKPNGGSAALKTLELSNDDPKLKTLADGVEYFELSGDKKQLLIRKDNSFYVIAADSGAPAKLEKSVSLGGWTFALNPRQEWRQMFTDAWRLERDYFYDTNMHGVDWPGMLKKYVPLVDRVTDREELSDAIAEMVGELSALHIFVVGGDKRDYPDHVTIGALGARLKRDASAGGYRVEHIFQTDPDYPEKSSPLTRPGVKIYEGDVLETINGISVLSQPDIGDLLRNQAGGQVLLHVKPKGTNAPHDSIVTPITTADEDDIRYSEWEYTRRLKTEELGKGDIGYLHLRAMGSGDMAQWTREFYPVFDRKGLIIDVRHNRGGNIDSWILEKLLRKAWFFWQARTGAPYWNMQYAFRGHIVVLCDERTASDGEAFTEGFKRLGLGKAIGMRTWGGEIWLSRDNVLVDKGIATAAEDGVYGPEGKWLIEGHGVDPDIVVDNLPHATFGGEDAQLKRAIEYLQDEIKRSPVKVPPPPQHPDKSFK